jgi:hypothetical protein
MTARREQLLGIVIALAKVFPAALIAVVGSFYLMEREAYGDAYKFQNGLRAQVSAAQEDLDRIRADGDRAAYLHALRLLSDPSDRNGYRGLALTTTALREYADSRQGRSIQGQVGELEHLHGRVLQVVYGEQKLDEEQLGKQVAGIVEEAETIVRELRPHFGIMFPLPPLGREMAYPWWNLLGFAAAASIVGVLVTSTLTGVFRLLANAIKRGDGSAK